jgi:hypothetical protein
MPQQDIIESHSIDLIGEFPAWLERVTEEELCPSASTSRNDFAPILGEETGLIDLLFDPDPLECV